MDALLIVSPLSAWLVMLALSARAASEPGVSARSWLTARHLVLAYLLPTAFLLMLEHKGLISPDIRLGLLICLLSGCGTSGAALARGSGGSAAAVASLMLASAGLAVVLLPLAVLLGVGNDAALASAGTVLAVLLLAQGLPYRLGLLRFRAHPPSPRLQAGLDRLASVSVLALIALIAWRELPRLLDHPGVTLAAAGTAILLGLVARPATTPHEDLGSMLVIRNLTAASLVASQLTDAPEVMTALCAFGLVMYPVALIQVWRAHVTRKVARGLL